MILKCFTNLRYKEWGTIDASEHIAAEWYTGTGSGGHFARRVRDLVRHYLTYCQLPKQNRGGLKNSDSYLKDEQVKEAVINYLGGIKKGEIKPKALRKEVNTIIFPKLNITPKNPICLRTARRWLVACGWRYSRVRKGIYVDGHEREDVVKYRTETFLPLMAKYQKQMATWEVEEGKDEMHRVAPQLLPDETEIIPVFHDECCFHVNDAAGSVWMKPGEQPLRKKSRGRLIHVSGFISPDSGRLVAHGASGEVVKESRIIIHPGKNGGDAWWDAKQLIKQMEDHALPVFKEAHPGKVGLWIFDQSSAHASLPEDAIRPFEMNKSDGGKQPRAHDTIIPESNPDPSKRGTTQKMTNPDGTQKGLKRVLQERGFDVEKLRAKCKPVCPIESLDCCMARLLSQQDDVKNQVSMLEALITSHGHHCIFLPKFHCELNPIEMVCFKGFAWDADHSNILQYWGWVKYRYREEEKAKFEDAKAAALKWLNACPDEVIRRFINRSWRFMDAYRHGLKGKAAEWAVRKQKGHRCTSETAMLALESVENIV
jgi:hypothetical protein